MADAILRPLFTERQILGSADLNLVVDHGRTASAETVRAVTTPGVVSGLELTSTDVPVTVAGSGGPIIAKQISIGRGVACDQYGRLIVVPDDVPFGEDYFETTIGKAETEPDGRSILYPVFLAPDDQLRRVAGTVGDSCSSASGPTRVAEGYQLRVGRPGDALPRALPPIAPGAGPDGDGIPREILLGFVRYHNEARRYVDHTDADGPVARAYAGIRADSVNGRHGRVVVHTRPEAPVGSPVLSLDDTGGKVLEVGTTLAQGAIDPLFSIDGKGNAWLKGHLASAFIVGQVAVDSGVINHGLKVRLPPGITEDQADAAALHIIVTPLPPPGVAEGRIAVNTRCEVAKDRTVTCEYIEFALGGTTSRMLKGSCRYLVIASASSSGGAS